MTTVFDILKHSVKQSVFWKCSLKNHVSVLVHCLNISKITTFRKLDLFPSTGKLMETPTLLDPLEIASFNHCTTSVKRSKTYKHLKSGMALYSCGTSINPSPQVRLSTTLALPTVEN
jgi:hypothetical protein